MATTLIDDANYRYHGTSGGKGQFTDAPNMDLSFKVTKEDDGKIKVERLNLVAPSGGDYFGYPVAVYAEMNGVRSSALATKPNVGDPYPWNPTNLSSPQTFTPSASGSQTFKIIVGTGCNCPSNGGTNTVHNYATVWEHTWDNTPTPEPEPEPETPPPAGPSGSGEGGMSSEPVDPVFMESIPIKFRRGNADSTAIGPLILK